MPTNGSPIYTPAPVPGTGGGTPSGPAGGDLTGTYPNPSLVTTAVTPGTYGSSTQLAIFTVDSKGRITAASNATTLGTAATKDFPAAGNASATQVVLGSDTRLTDSRTPSGSAGGDLTGAYPNPTLATTTVTGGTYGSSTQVPSFTVDAKGRLTAASNAATLGGAATLNVGTAAGTVAAGDDSRFTDSRTPSGTAGGDLTGSYPNPTLGTSGVTAGTYGSSTQVASVTVDAKGRVTAASNAATLGGAATLNVGTAAGTVAAGNDSRFTDSRTPTGAAGGDLGGTYPNPTITGKPTGPFVGTTDTQTLTNKRITRRVSTTTSSATPSINTDTTDMFGLTAQTVDISSFSTNLTGTPTNGQTLWIYIVGTAARAITWGPSFEASLVTLPTTTVSTNRLDVGFVWNAATSKWRCVASS